jgi:hypothetical protein
LELVAREVSIVSPGRAGFQRIRRRGYLLVPLVA